MKVVVVGAGEAVVSQGAGFRRTCAPPSSADGDGDVLDWEMVYETGPRGWEMRVGEEGAGEGKERIAAEWYGSEVNNTAGPDKHSTNASETKYR
jgi:hypothetical protein